ncbi:unnamed protein product [Mytilus coruscus]|uniref:DZIP3-like HEPN domain-containing protein n=1 Tax=Mytilus coruscus TaxID=42192 RepID=A0A6J8EA01_MYTCO|nr:unnamed protein product [Mytilus coruscus]
MLSKSRIWNCNFVLIWLVLQTAVLYTESYDFKCPSQASWRLRAHVKCNSTKTYFFLYNNVAGTFVEGCDGPDWDRKGSKRIFAGDFSRGICKHKRFQPILFLTNGSMTDCIYEKSLCNEEGQVVYGDNSTKDDRSCRCDHKQNFAFIKNPRNLCFCIPTEEDCSCHVKSCPVNLTLSSAEQVTEEMYYLRLIHLLFRVTCPVVRMKFNHEIQPNQLRKTLDGQKAVLEKMYRKKEKIINDSQWSLLFGRVKDRLLVLSPITVDNTRLRIFIYLSDLYPAILLRQVISEYCMLHSLTIENILKMEKHELYHKRINTESCCICHTESSNFYKLIPEKQWKAFYETKKGNSMHSCPWNLKQCIELIVPKKIDTMDISMSKTLILNIPDILIYMVQRLCTSGFDQFLKHNQHVIYHSMEEKICCNCSEVSAEKKIINKGEWNKLFKKDDNISCKIGNKNCCCQYSVRRGIRCNNIEYILLIKIFNVVGPIAVLNKVEQDAFLYFLTWTVDDQPLRRALTDLLNIIGDKMINVSTPSFIHSKSEETKAKQSDVRMWIARHLRKQEATTEQQLQILIQDEDVLSVKSVLIPKYFTLPVKTKKFEGLTSEENNYLVVVHGLTKIVYPIIKNEFNTQCPDHVLDEIRFSIYEKQMQVAKTRRRDGTRGWKKRIHLTPDHQRQLFSQTREESKNLDLELMIYILKKRSNYEWNKTYIDQLDVIEKIRRQIVQSTSGTLDQTQFNDILHSISKSSQKVYIDELNQVTVATIHQLYYKKGISIRLQEIELEA